MKEPTDLEQKEFWEGCGLHYTSPYWVDDDDNLAFYGDHPIDLNNLFKFAVPKLGMVTLQKTDHHEEYVATVVDYGLNKEGKVFDKDPALALFSALYPVITGKEVGE